MKKIVGALLAVGLTGPVFAQDDFEPVGPTFNSRGECESFLARENNAARREASGDRSPSEQNRFTRENFECRSIGNGQFQIFRNPAANS
jgi:hypothetical protein